MSQRTNQVSWLLYDFGNSFFVTAISGLFLAQWIIIDNKIDDLWYGGAFALATFLVLLTAQSLGAWSDRVGRRIPFLRWLTLLLILANGAMAVVALASGIPMRTRGVAVLVISVVVQYLYQLSLVHYNALLDNVSTRKNRGRICGIGEGFASSGWLIATLVLLPFANGAITLFAEPGRHQVFLPAFVISSLLMLPLISAFREKAAPIARQSAAVTTTSGLSRLWREDRNAAIFLIAYALISDIILTLTLYFAVVMDALYHVDDKTKSVVFIINMLFSVGIGYALGRLADRYGNKPVIIASCINLALISLLFFTSSSLSVLYLVAVLGGAGVGGYWVVTRSLMIKLSPPRRLGEYFGYFSAFNRFASILAPLLWGLVTYLLRDEPVLRYQVAGILMVVLLVIGTIVLLFVREQRSRIPTMSRNA